MKTEQPWYLDHQRPEGAPKVYCASCRFYEERRHHVATMQVLTRPPARYLCWHPHALETMDTFRGPVTVQMDANERNAHNDCPDYVRYQLSWRWAWEYRRRHLLLGAMVLVLSLCVWLRGWS